MEVDDIATDVTELATPTAVDPAADDTRADATGDRDGGEATEPEKPANRWQALKDAISDFGEGKLEPLTPPAAEAATEVSEDEQPEKPEAAKPDGSKPEPPRFTITDAEGAELDVEWPEGVRVSFKMDGKPVEVTSFDQLVQMAQKGPMADRLDAELSRRT